MDLRNGAWVMEVVSTLILTNETCQISPINHELSGRTPFFIFYIPRSHENNNIFKMLHGSGCYSPELKGRLLIIIIMRPLASLTRCLLSGEVSLHVVQELSR
jgi:hypothetical protein